MERLLKMDDGEKSSILRVLCRKENDGDVSENNKLGVEFFAGENYECFLGNILPELNNFSCKLLEFIPIDYINRKICRGHGLFDIYAEMRSNNIIFELDITYPTTAFIENLKTVDEIKYHNIIKQIKKTKDLVNKELCKVLNNLIADDYLLVKFEKGSIRVDINNELIIKEKRNFNISEEELHEFIDNTVGKLIEKSEYSEEIAELYLGEMNEVKEEQLTYKIQKELNRSFLRKYGID